MARDTRSNGYYLQTANVEADMFLDIAAQDTRHDPAPRAGPRDLSDSTYQAIIDRIARAPEPAQEEQRFLSDHNAQRRLSDLSTYHTPINGRSRQSSVTLDKPQDAPRPRSTASASPTSLKSTVWDELDDLRSRLKRLEMTGNRTMPADNARVNDHHAHRRHPRHTSRTDVTDNVSLRGRADAHSSLRTALSNARSLIEPRAYRALEAAATNALALSALADTLAPKDAVGSAYSIINGDADNYDQLRQHADALCGDIADLCKSLSDSVFRDSYSTPQIHSSPLPAGDPASSRLARRSLGPQLLTPRLDSRNHPRSSISRLNLVSTPRSGDDSGATSQRSPQGAKDYTARWTLAARRESTSCLNNHAEGESDDVEPLPSAIRPSSRAQTEVGSLLSTAARRTSYLSGRDYLHAGPQRSPSLREVLESRRTSTITSTSNVDTDGRSESYMTPSVVRPQSSISRRMTMERRDFARKNEHAERDTKFNRLSLLGQYQSSGTTVQDHVEPTPDALRSGLLRQSSTNRHRTTQLHGGSTFVPRAR